MGQRYAGEQGPSTPSPQTTSGRNFAQRLFGSPDLMIWPLLETHLAKFIVIQNAANSSKSEVSGDWRK
jgi:hypothetical protein